MSSLTTMATNGKLGDLGLMKGDWQERLAYIVDAMRDMSLQTDPQEMVRSYGARVRKLLPAARWLSLSRRGLESPWYRITRSSTWTEADRSLEAERPAAAPEGGLAGRLDLRRRAPADR